jgi:hypothetical protein
MVCLPAKSRVFWAATRQAGCALQADSRICSSDAIT